MPRAHAPRKPTPAPRTLVDDLRGAARLAAEAASGITDVVEAMHLAIGAGPAVLGRPLEAPLRRITRPVYGTIRGGMQRVGASVEAALARVALLLGPRLGERSPWPEREAALAVLSGVLGDYLEQTKNPLAIEMRLRSGGHPLELEAEALRSAFPRASRKLLVLVHGSCVSDHQWRRGGHDHGAALARDLGFTPVYLHYNTGLHVSVNGRRLAALLEELARAWPVPLDELVILAHSMGGLVARSACHLGEVTGHRWRRKLRGLVCVGTPHHGAPLERGGHWIDLLLGLSWYSRPLARLGKIRSAGVTDMRYGCVRDEDWQDRDRFAYGKDARTPLALPAGVACYAIAATTAARGTKQKRPGDGLVPVASALGRHARPELTLEFPAANPWVAHATNHVQLLSRPEVYGRLRTWLAP
jgi:hypothetical protein